MVTGSCECGAVRYQIKGPMRDVTVCHCGQCRKSSGHIWAATQVAYHDLELAGDAPVKWYRSSDQARRAFCTECGSSLFWRMDGEDKISVGAGTLNAPTGLKIAREIFTQDCGDYYQVPPE